MLCGVDKEKTPSIYQQYDRQKRPVSMNLNSTAKIQPYLKKSKYRDA
jgi:hypothetical protein